MRADSAYPEEPSRSKRTPEGRWLGSAKLPSRLAIAIATFVAVFAWRLALQPVLGPVAPYLGFLFAIVVATRTLGWLAGLVALGASVAVANYNFHPGPPGFGIPHPGAAAQLILFVMTSLLLIGLDRSLLMSNRSLAAEAESRREAEREARELAATLERKVAERTSQLLQSRDRVEALNSALDRRARALSEAVEELESFSYSVSHDLKAPLRAIDSRVAMLVEESEGLNVEERDALDRVRRDVRKMAELTDDLLMLAKVGRSELRVEDVRLSEIVREKIATESARWPRDRMAIELQDGVVVRGDRRLLEVVVDNLVRNAWKFSSACDRTVVRFFVADADGEPCYCVEDEGAGFDESDAGRLFQPFQRLASAADFEGTGIGLAIVKRVIERHGGRVWASGRLGTGARFCFTLGLRGSEESHPSPESGTVRLTADSFSPQMDSKSVARENPR